ncbi:MAG: Ppx/GppA family phosphatase [Alphaproteobacteria bacterium]|nr:Ppx/GppA family phosphatase [Alphaproteobacteria bacterium]
MPTDVASVRARPAPGNVSTPFGVVDIGSNSVRLVIFRALRRSPVILHNEKVMCGIGRALASTGRLDADGAERALSALTRFRVVAEGLHVGTIEAVATAAARDAENGRAFLDEAERRIGAPIRLLSGEEEARYSALGVIAGIPGADGIVGDLGGGSLELCSVARGEVGRGVTLPLGPLRLADVAGSDMAKVRKLVAEAVAGVSWLHEMRGRTLYAVGGAWRAFARLRLETTHHPLHILHAYAIPRQEAIDFARFLAGQSRRSMERIADISRRRLELMPYAAVVLGEVVGATPVDEVVVSAFGLREGLLYDRLSPEEQARDPLIEAARGIGEREGRDPAFAEPLVRWTGPLFPDETRGESRLRMAAAHLSDLAWRAHPDYRSELAFSEILTAPIAGVTHSEHVRLALALHHRYVGVSDPDGLERFKGLLDPLSRAWAKRVGLAFRFAFALTAGSPDILKGLKLRVQKDQLLISRAGELGPLFDDRTMRHLVQLAELCQLKPEVAERD